ncbi:MAG: dihydrolipoyl dehydrogenase [Candidatus Thorarchaeota archaeon]|nr:dihydrolipoyl dehydrogenase [Candidatus Thorarchaeota archaeon]
MKNYDVLVLGSGAGSNVGANAYQQGLSVAIVDNGRFGGTCLNRGCIPTKMLTYVADVIMEIQHAERVNLKARVEEVDFPALMERMRKETWGEADEMKHSIAQVENYDFYNGTGKFVDDYTMEVNGEKIKAEHVILAPGGRPFIPEIKGLDKVDFLTNKTVLALNEAPKSMIIVGGGYIASEFAHFFSAIGTEVTILGRNPFMVKEEDNDVSELLKEELSKRMKILTNHEVVSANQNGDSKKVIARDRESGAEREFEAETILMAAGRISNADLFRPEKTGVKVNKRGWIIVDDYFRTNKKNIWAFGDAIGRYQFRHVANDESQIVWYNFVQTLNAKQHGGKPDLRDMSYHAIPRAVFSYPPIATVGMTLAEAKESKNEILVGQIGYDGAAKGSAMGNPPGFLRVIADANDRKILGATIIGPHAPVLIQEIINLMYTPDRTYLPMFDAIHIHPALSELVQRAFGRLAPIDGGRGHHH